MSESVDRMDRLKKILTNWTPIIFLSNQLIGQNYNVYCVSDEEKKTKMKSIKWMNKLPENFSILEKIFIDELLFKQYSFHFFREYSIHNWFRHKILPTNPVQIDCFEYSKEYGFRKRNQFSFHSIRSRFKYF